jgi:rubredoxin
MPKVTIDILARRRFLQTVPTAWVAVAGGAAATGRAAAPAAAEPDCFAYPPDPACWADDPRLAKIWRCGNSDCPGYSYDPLRGEHTQDIPPGTAFEDLPDDFHCPACGADKSFFRLSRDRAKATG